MALTTVSSQGIGFATGRRNLIINGAMQVAQRGTSSTSAGFQTVDRFEINRNNTDQIATTQSQSTTAPDGFAYSYKHVATTAETAVAADERVRVRQNIEAQNLQHLKYGTSGAEKVTLSFYVRSNVTGTYACNILGDDASRQIGGTYTINTADTWERKEITFDGDTATHTIANDNGVGFTVSFYLLAGTNYTATDNTSWGASATGKEAYGHTADWGEDANDEWYITGVQLEVGSRASDFEHHSYGEELQLCSRYYQQITFDGGSAVAIGFQSSATGAQAVVHYPYGLMRVAPTITLPSAGQGANLMTFLKKNTGYPTTTGSHSGDKANTAQYFLTGIYYAGLEGGGLGTWLYTGSSGGSITFKYSAEL